MDRITAVYDGKVLVLQQPVDWEAGKVVEVLPETLGQDEKDAAFERLLRRVRHGGGADFDRGDLYP